MAKADLHSDRNLMIVGFILFMGLSIPAWIKGWAPWQLFRTPTGVVWNPGENVISNIFPNALAGIIISIAGSGMAVAAILGLILDNWIPGSDKERGVEAVEQEPYAPIT